MLGCRRAGGVAAKRCRGGAAAFRRVHFSVLFSPSSFFLKRLQCVPITRGRVVRCENFKIGRTRSISSILSCLRLAAETLMCVCSWGRDAPMPWELCHERW